MYNSAFHTNDLSRKTLLITGGAGFIGSNIVEYLLKYNPKKIIVLDNLATGFQENIDILNTISSSSGRAGWVFEFINGNICNIDDCHKACKNVDYVFHQAALGSVPRSIKDPIATHNVNATGFINILIAARDAKVKRVVYASSSSVYGDSPVLPKIELQIGKQLSPCCFKNDQ